MKKLKATATNYRLHAFFCVCIGIALASFNLSDFRVNASKTQLEFSVKSPFPELEIIQANLLGLGTVQVIMRNGYKKDITAIVTAVGKDTTVQRDYIYAELEPNQKLSAGGSDKFLFNPQPGEEIVIRSVLFSDMTVEGNRQEIKTVLDTRSGVRIQLSCINPQLESLSRVTNPMIQAELQRIKQFAESLPLEKDDMSEGLEHGLRDGRNLILKYISEIETKLGKERVETSSNGKQSITFDYTAIENFKRHSARVENDFKSLERRL
ncbi:MAG: hypothetical protein WBV94_11220 [Blastocatellia bacterium]